MPAYGFFIRHAKNVEMNHVQLILENDDFRPAFILDDVTSSRFNDLKVEKTGKVPSVVLKNVEDLSFQNFNTMKEKLIRRTNFSQF
jgi:hypothetical protein